MAKTYNNHKNDKVSIQVASSTKDQYLKEVSNIHRQSYSFFIKTQSLPNKTFTFSISEHLSIGEHILTSLDIYKIHLNSFDNDIINHRYLNSSLITAIKFV
ncbi:hypothetical protein EAJ01_26855 [Bacteroides cellulosilyticus]|jgi:hypothetical protein|nr:hypothetical protein EAJ01_26855 [Bacteroides cellulosilyticus]